MTKEIEVHELKTWPQYWEALESGAKTFEVRKLDRLFGVGDTLHLREWSPLSGYSGREMKKTITYVMPGGQWGLSEGNCILGIKPLLTPSGDVQERSKEYIRSKYGNPVKRGSVTSIDDVGDAYLAGHAGASGELESLKAENERLREALEYIHGLTAVQFTRKDIKIHSITDEALTKQQ